MYSIVEYRYHAEKRTWSISLENQAFSHKSRLFLNENALFSQPYAKLCCLGLVAYVRKESESY